MTKRMRSILSRVLSEEIYNQLIWKQNDINNGFDGTDRDNIISDIKDFMTENGIEIKLV